MNIEDIAKWLKRHHDDNREWLARQCGSEKSTVNSWFSTRPLPRHAAITIERLMSEDAAREAITDIPSALVLHWTKDEFRIIQEAARKAGMLTDEWAERELLEIAKSPIIDATEPAPTETEEEIAAREVEEYKRNRALHPPRNQSKIAPKKKDTGNDNRQVI